MSTDKQIRAAQILLNADQSDEKTERLTGVSLLEIIGLRAGRATAPNPLATCAQLLLVCGP